MTRPAHLHSLRSTRVAFLAAATVLVTSLVVVGRVIAQVEPPVSSPASLSESSITAIPPRIGEDFSLKAKPGEKIQTSVRVRNGSSEPLLIKTVAQDFIVGDNGETPIPITETEISNRWSLASWMILSPAVNQIEPGKATTINVIIDVPADALPGGHYAMITHQPTFGTDGQQDVIGLPASASFLNQRVGTLVYVTVDGLINEAAFIRNLTFPKFTEYGPVPFSFQVDNRSDIHIRPQLNVDIYNLFGRKVETIPIETRNIFPFIARDFAGQWDRVWGFGPYTAKVVMSYGNQGQIAMAQTTFWLLPITLLLALLLVLLVLLVIAVLIRRHIKHRRENQQTQIQQLQSRVRELEEKKYEQFDT